MENPIKFWVFFEFGKQIFSERNICGQKEWQNGGMKMGTVRLLPLGRKKGGGNNKVPRGNPRMPKILVGRRGGGEEGKEMLLHKFWGKVGRKIRGNLHSYSKN